MLLWLYGYGCQPAAFIASKRLPGEAWAVFKMAECPFLVALLESGSAVLCDSH